MSKNSSRSELNTTVEETIIKEISKELKNDELNKKNIQNGSIEKSAVPAPVPTESPWKIVGKTSDVGVSIQDVQDKLGLLLQKQNGKRDRHSASHQLMKKTMSKESHVLIDANIIISDTNTLNNLQSVPIDGKVEIEKPLGLEKTKQRKKKRKPRNRKKGGSASSNSTVNKDQQKNEEKKKMEEIKTEGEREKGKSLLVENIEKNGQNKNSKPTSKQKRSVKQEESKITVNLKSSNKDSDTTTKKEKKQHKRKQLNENKRPEHEHGHNNKDTHHSQLENKKTVKYTHGDVHLPQFQIGNVAKQLQYYFSDENLIKDEYLKSLFSSVCGFVPLSTIAGFYRLSNMSNGGDSTIILGAIYSLLLRVTNEDTNFEIATIDLPLMQDNVLSKYLIRSKKWELYLTTDSKPIEYNKIKLINHGDLAEYEVYIDHS